jgi:hypothetical protein
MFHIEADVTWCFATVSQIVGQSFRKQALINLVVQALTEYEWLRLDINQRVIDVLTFASF